MEGYGEAIAWLVIMAAIIGTSLWLEKHVDAIKAWIQRH